MPQNRKNMKQINYTQLFTIQSKIESTLRKACPNINNRSGIYFLTREDESKKYAYIGKGVNILRRMVSHIQGYDQRIDFSLRKRGFYSEENNGGWHLNILNFDEKELDEREHHFIDLYKNANYEMYNIESGGTTGKTDINQRKLPKTYTEGVTYGILKTKRKVKEYFDKYLDYSIKDKPTKIKERKFAEFGEFIKVEEKEEESGEK